MARRSRGWLIAAALAVVGATLSACGDEAGGAADGKKEYVAMSFAGGDITIWNDTIKAMKPQIEQAGFGFLSDDPQWKAEKQVADWQAWIQRGDVKAIMGFPVQADALVPVTQQAKDAGITVISYASDWEGATKGLTVNDYESAKVLGRDAGTWIEEELGGEAVVAVLAERTTDLGSARADGLIDGVQEVAPGATIVELGGKSGRESGYSQAKAQLAAEPDTTVWITQSDDLASGAYQALLDSGVEKDDPNVFVGSLDATQETLDKLEIPNSIYRLAYIVTAQTIADINASVLIAAARGEAVEAQEVIFDKITGENASEYRE